MKAAQPIPDKVITITVKTNDDRSTKILIDHTEIGISDFIGILEQVKHNILLQSAK